MAAPMPVAARFAIQQMFGARPVVAARVNGRPIALVIHANAGPYLQVNHAEAASADIGPLTHESAYGISSPGKVSALGRDRGVLQSLRIGGWSAEDVPVAVFEVPAGGSQGMLGLPWLTQNRVALDFARRRALIRGASAAPQAPMRPPGADYVAVPMRRDPSDGRYLVDVRIGDATAPMVVSTVAGIDLDVTFAARAKVELGKVVGSYGGPTGATGDVYGVKAPVVLRLGGWTSPPMRPSVEDTYAYATTPRPTAPGAARGGDLGADFLIRTRAIVDFGDGVLYLKRPAVSRASSRR